MSTQLQVQYEALSQADKFRILRDEYLERLKPIIPRVTSEQLDAAICVVNQLRPAYWAQSDFPGEIIGRTKDNQIVYAGDGSLPLLYVAGADELRTRIVGTMNKLRGTSKGQLGLQVQDVENPTLEHLKGLESVLDGLERQSQ